MTVFDQNYANTHLYGMDFRSLIIKIMQAGDLTQTQVGARVGVTQATVSRWLDARKPQEPYYSQYQRIITLAEQYGLVAPQSGAITVPLISWVSAGELAVAETVYSLADAPRVTGSDLDPLGDWIALDVEGDSMDRISPPGSRIFVNRRNKRLVTNACYVITADDGGATYKRYRAGPERWEPVSTNPVHETLYPPTEGGPIILGRVMQTRLLL